MATQFFFQASQEHFAPEDLLEQAVAAERAGFDGISSSDHLQPWWEPGESGHTWPWLGAAAARTERVPIGTGITPPGPRYHPAMIAQAWITLERMFPGRPFLGFGSGEALNEVPVSGEWPSVGKQIERMEEALEMIRRLWAGDTIDGGYAHWAAKDLRLHTLADRHPPIWVSAFGPQAAAVAARHGDGVWTLADPDNAPEVIEAYRSAATDPGEIVLHVGVSYAPDDAAALEAVRRWKGSQPIEFYRDDWHKPAEMYAEGERQLSDDDLREAFIVGPDPAEHAARLQEIVDLGATIVVVQNNSGADPLGMVRIYGEEVLPRLRQHTPSKT